MGEKTELSSHESKSTSMSCSGEGVAWGFYKERHRKEKVS